MATRGNDPEDLGFGDGLLANCLIGLRLKHNKDGAGCPGGPISNWRLVRRARPL